MRTILTACLLAAGLTTASAEPARLETGTMPSGPAKAAIERWFTVGRDVTCSGGDTTGDACDLGRGLAFRTAYDRAGTRAVAFVLYSPVVSNHVALAVAQFRKDGDDWTFVRTVRGIQGEGPGSVDLQGDRASFAMAVAMPGDARCCATGTLRYDLDLATGTVTPAPTASAKAASPARPVGTATAGFNGYAFTHNGSMVLVDERLGEIRYDEPKPSMRGVVGKGTVLFRGVFGKGGTVTGMAYAFKTGCEPAPYAVEGTIKGPDIVLRGVAPRRDPGSCAVIGTSGASPHAVLRFQEYGDL